MTGSDEAQLSGQKEEDDATGEVSPTGFEGVDVTATEMPDGVLPPRSEMGSCRGFDGELESL